MTDISEDVMEAALAVQKKIGATGYHIPLCRHKECDCEEFCKVRRDIIARAIMAALAAQAERMARLEEALRRLLKCEYDGQGLTDCIDNDGHHYPSQELDNAIVNAEAVVSARALSQEGSEPS